MPPLSPCLVAWQVLVNQPRFLSTQYVSEVVIGAPYSVTAELLDHFKVRVGLLVGAFQGGPGLSGARPVL